MYSITVLWYGTYLLKKHEERRFIIFIVVENIQYFIIGYQAL